MSNTGVIDVCHLRPWARPEITSVGRLPMRPQLVAYKSSEDALRSDVFDRAAMLNLNGEWQFSFFETPEEALSALEKYFDDGGDPACTWDAIQVPGNWTLQGWDRPHYTNVSMPFSTLPPEPPANNPSGIYRRRFSFDSTVHNVEGERFVLHVGGVESMAILWLNGQFIGMTKDSRLESEFDISSFLNNSQNSEHSPDSEHELIILVIRYSDASFIEDQDQWWMAGLHRDVYIRRENRIYPHQLYVRSSIEETGIEGSSIERSSTGGRRGKVSTEIELAGLASGGGSWEVEVSLYNYPGDLLNNLSPPPIPSEALVKVSGTSEGYPQTTASWVKTLMSTEPNRANRLLLETEAVDVQPWSSESPCLYTALISIRDRKTDTVIAVYRRRIGFRHVEVRDRKLLVNGEAVMIHGVNRHEHDPDNGKVLSRSSMIRDLQLLRQFNFNAVRAAHYPNHPDWYDLCDQYGIYVWDEANIESHAHYDEVCRDSRYSAAFLDRVQRMVQRDFDHPSVLVWSLGNESGYGENHDAAAGWLRRKDPDRPIHYEGAVRKEWGQNDYDFSRGTGVSDIIAPMYAPVDAVDEWAEHINSTDPECILEKRPLIFCEYSHAMGNSNGGLEDYYRAFYQHEGLQGGFIWDWVDQGLRLQSPDGSEYFAYGGDFGDEPTDRDFCLNGLVSPDREPHPAMWEFKKLAQPYTFLYEQQPSVDGGSIAININITSRRNFTTLKNCSLHWSLCDWGRELAGGSMSLPEIAPGESGECRVHATSLPQELGKERILSLRIVNHEASALSPADHEIAYDQWVVAEAPAQALPAGVHSSGKSLDIDMDIDTDVEGGIPRMSTPGGLSIAGPTLFLWRAPTENDVIRNMPFQEEKPGTYWKEQGLNALEASWKKQASGQLHGLYTHKGKRRAELTINCVPDGDWYRLSIHVDIDTSIKDLPRIGLGFVLPEGFECLNWYGRGPGENYPDRTAASLIGLWQHRIDEEAFPYIVPQEYGGRSAARFLRISKEFFVDDDGKAAAGTGDNTGTARSAGAGGEKKGIFELAASQGEHFHFSALHYAPEDMDSIHHTWEMKPRRETILIADLYHRGIGTAACGPDTHPRWVRGGGNYSTTWYIRVR